MKKTLLIAVATVMVALGANAQFARIAQNTRKYNPSAEKMEVMKAQSSNIVANANHVSNQVSRRAVGDIAGTYIMDNANYNGDFTSSSSFKIESATGTTKVYNLETDVDDVDFEYNVVLTNFTYEGAIAYGKYENGFITIPVQTIANNDTYGRIVFSAVTKVGDSPAHIGFDMLLEVMDDGSIEIYGAEEELKEAGYEEGEYISGFYNFLPDSSGAWNYGFDSEFFAKNGVMSADVSGYLRTDGQTQGWQDERAEYPIAVEDFNGELVVHNFIGMAPISINVNEDGTAAIPLPQFVDDHDYSEDGGFEYGCMRLVGVDLEGTSLRRNYDKNALTGSVTKTDEAIVYDFFELNEEGKVVQDENHSPYLAVASAADGDGAAYGMGYLFAIRLIALNVSTGINETKANCQKTTGKTFNLMGQEVNASAKGLIIRDGKKMLNK